MLNSEVMELTVPAGGASLVSRKMNVMGITTKFNLILIGVLGLGFAVFSAMTHRALYDNAYREVVAQAGLMMDSSMALRSYTEREIRPLLKPQLTVAFPPQIVPAYAATQSFMQLRKNNPEYSYKEASTNPTNPRDRALDWEADIIRMFRNKPDLEEFSGMRDTPGGQALYLARPIRVTDEGCLACHGLPSAAPATMIERYGNDNGFGWEMGKVVGAQIVSVPADVPIAKAQSISQLLMVMLAAICGVIILLANVLLRVFVTRPIQRMSQTANEVSQGNMEVPEFETNGKDELSVLAKSFNRMRRSLDKAMAMLDSERS
ncbi:DUF3365 domain-containing protein [Marinobacter sp. F4216]|uniref:Tll0287-like domain-containing protein n=1 Tax=Marinobacter sp. F4216 TaxID=2874281 RepID=UPI001CC1550D|nr:DUF3365 domain-containing protein [Marinobacter sp. F4216]MBZ2168627.1 DUF3365 domain-containing protein [Marinobacter sp. F4216]